MNDRTFYQNLREEVIKHLDEENISFSEFVDELTSKYGKSDFELTVSINGQDVILNRDTTEGNDYEIARLDDPIQFAWFRLKGDELILFDEGYYDSWSGGEFENDVRVGTIRQHTIDFPAEVK